MDLYGLTLDLIAFTFIFLSFIFAVKNYHLVKAKEFLWLVLATLYGTILRGIHLARNFDLPVPSPLITSRAFSLFYVLLFAGVLSYYLPLQRIWKKLKKQE